jgi:hypothetical protein
MGKANEATWRRLDNVEKCGLLHAKYGEKSYALSFEYFARLVPK